MIKIQVEQADGGYSVAWRTSDESLFNTARFAFREFMQQSSARFDGATRSWHIGYEARLCLRDFLDFMVAHHQADIDDGGMFESDEVEDDPYAALYLLPSAPLEVVRAAHKALAVLHHPDKGGSTERMQRINAAFDEIMRSLPEAKAA